MRGTTLVCPVAITALVVVPLAACGSSRPTSEAAPQACAGLPTKEATSIGLQSTLSFSSGDHGTLTLRNTSASTIRYMAPRDVFAQAVDADGEVLSQIDAMTTEGIPEASLAPGASVAIPVGIAKANCPDGKASIPSGTYSFAVILNIVGEPQPGYRSAVVSRHI